MRFCFRKKPCFVDARKWNLVSHDPGQYSSCFYCSKSNTIELGLWIGRYCTTGILFILAFVAPGIPKNYWRDRNAVQDDEEVGAIHIYCEPWHDAVVWTCDFLAKYAGYVHCLSQRIASLAQVKAICFSGSGVPERAVCHYIARGYLLPFHVLYIFFFILWLWLYIAICCDSAGTNGSSRQPTINLE